MYNLKASSRFSIYFINRLFICVIIWCLSNGKVVFSNLFSPIHHMYIHFKREQTYYPQFSDGPLWFVDLPFLSFCCSNTFFFFSNDEMSCFGTKLFMRVGRRWDHSTACPRGSGAKHLHQTHLLWCHRLDRNKMTEVLSFLIHNEPRWFRFIASNDLN